MIPKIIHYCWFGQSEMPDLAKRCIESWRKYCPNYELKLWNEDNFDVNSNDYVREAYNVKKYAFVSDYVRLWVLNEFGGIYMDTDVEVLKPLDDLIKLTAFTGYEASQAKSPVTGIIASESHGSWVKEQLAYYKGKHFIFPDGTVDLTPNTKPISFIMQNNGFIIDGKYQVYKDMHIFPVDYFCPLTSTRVLKLTENTYCIHHFAGSWKSETIYEKIKDFVADRVLGRKLTDRIVHVKHKFIHKKR